MGLFGPSKNEIWQQLSQEVQGTFIDGGLLHGTSVEATHKSWRLYLDTYTVTAGNSTTTYTRMRASFVDQRGFYFKIYLKSLFSDMGKALGMQDICVGYDDFDEQYIIQGNDEGLLISLFSNPKIRELIGRQPRIKLEIRKNEGIFGPRFSENEGELYFLVPGVIKDIEVLKSLFELFSEVLETLQLIGCVGSEVTDVKL